MWHVSHTKFKKITCEKGLVPVKSQKIGIKFWVKDYIIKFSNKSRQSKVLNR